MYFILNNCSALCSTYPHPPATSCTLAQDYDRGISLDTWSMMLDFSRNVKKDLSGWDESECVDVTCMCPSN